ncbi:MAG: hypothetical protein GC168_13590 [Candidatus Hydrogenedens sp.]|nr:hypothetical protein [Candidatus Hydrogenedens sp.]
MITTRKSDTRGHADHGWLDSKHSFSFAHYYDPAHMGFRSLRVFNDDLIGGGGGFPPHPHNDMEIVSYVTRGALRHRDNMGNESVLRAGAMQRMTAGTGVIHSEFNDSDTEPAHLYQIWILPERRGIAPGYEEAVLAETPAVDGWQLIAAPEGAGGAMTIHQDTKLYRGVAAAGETLRHTLASGRGAWLHVVRGAITLNGAALTAGDEAQTEDETALEIAATDDAEVLLFDVA